jgi:hypothetical protein
MKFAKYVIDNFGRAMIFSPDFKHDQFCLKQNAVAAGFCQVDMDDCIGSPMDFEVTVMGESLTLGLSCRKDKDPEILKKMLRPF